MPKTFCVKHNNTKKKLPSKQFVKFIETNYKKQCDMIKIWRSCKMCIPFQNILKMILKNHKKK